MPALTGSSTDDLGSAGAMGEDRSVKGKDVSCSHGHEPRTIPDVARPTAQEVARDNLTRLPYSTWCSWCVMSRKPKPKHRRSHVAKRDVPIRVGDCAFARISADEELLTIFVGRRYPT